jgi:hypothetical protein
VPPPCWTDYGAKDDFSSPWDYGVWEVVLQCNGILNLGRAGIAVWLAAASLVMLPTLSLGADQTPYLIDDFDSPTALQNWQLEKPPGFPASSGGLALGPGHSAHGAVITYRLSCDQYPVCADYVTALWRAAIPPPKSHHPAISLWIRFPSDVEISLVTKDTKNQTIRFLIRATIEHPRAGAWQYILVPLSDNPDSDGTLKGRLVELGIRIQARFGLTAEGSVSFDDLRLLDCDGTFQIDAAAQTDPPQPDSLELRPRLGVNIHLLRDDPALDAAQAAGFGFIRMDLLWANIEKGGSYRFLAYDRLLRALDARGMGVLWILDYGHPDHGGGAPRTPEDIAAFGRFVEAAAGHFKGRNVRYEIWNEPDVNRFWDPFPKASEYGALLREALAAIRRADPSAKVSSGGVSKFDQDFLSQAVGRNLASALTAIGVHPYTDRGPETIAPELGMLSDWVTRALGERIEVWDTEWGYSSTGRAEGGSGNGHTDVGRERQASLAVREILTVWAVGFPLAVWYDLRDNGPDPANPEHNYGLLDSSGNEKPAIRAVRNLTALLNGRKYAGMIRKTQPGIHAMRLDGSTDIIAIVWTDETGGRRTVEFPKRDLISASDLFGKAIPWKDGPSDRAQVKIDADDGPIYLRWTSGSRGELHSDRERPEKSRCGN